MIKILLLAFLPLAATPPVADAKRSHYCAEACVGPCSKAESCNCDGRYCPVILAFPDGKLERTLVFVERLPSRKKACPDRNILIGPTWRRHPSGYAWICNDPDCAACEPDNAEFRAPFPPEKE